jgi:glycosyltransferase involved in cell wall biosynthesis
MKICISTQNPSLGGGVGRQVQLMIDYLKEANGVTLLFPSNPIKNMFFEDKEDWHSKERTITKRVYLPLMVLNNQVFPRLVRNDLDDFDSFVSVGGQNFESAAFMFAGKKYFPWVATTFEDEWRHVSGIGSGLARILRNLNNMTKGLLRKMERKIYFRSEKVLSVSNYTKQRIIKEFGITDDKISVVPNPVDTQLFSPRGAKIDKDRFILFVGRLDPRKNLQILLKSFKTVLRKINDLKLVIIGTGPEKRKLVRLVSELGIGSSVEFMDFVHYEDLPKYYRSCEMFVLPSNQEGFGIVLIEAMASGKPVVSTKCGGPTDFVVDGKNGLLVDTNDEKAMAEGIVELMRSRSVRDRMGKAGLKTSQNFDKQTVGKLLVSKIRP